MKHTPGPWEFLEQNESNGYSDINVFGSIIEREEGFTIAALWHLYKDDIEESVYNGKLIAAAPDLLEALIMCYDKLLEQDMLNTEAGKLAVSAIKKATE